MTDLVLSTQPMLAASFLYAGFIALGLSGTAATVATVVVIAAATAGSFVYQRAQQRKAQAAARAQAERLRKEQARAIAEQSAALRELSKLGDQPFFQGPTDLTVMVRRSVISRRFVYGRARVGGIWLYVETTGSSNDFVHLVLGLCEGPIEDIEAIYFDDELVTFDASTGLGSGKWAGVLRVKKHLGTSDQVADADLVTDSDSKWTAAHKLKGIAYLYLRFTRNLDVFPTLPDVSAIIKGKNDILDPRTAAVGYTDNAALCLADYLSLPLRGPGIPREEIDNDALVHAANVCDQPVELLAGGTEPRYTVSGSIDLAATIEDNIASFIQSMAGDMIFANGVYEIQAGEYRTPTFEITADMLVEGFTVSHLQPRKDRINVVKGTFVAEANRWQRFDFPAVSRTTYVEADAGETVRDLTLEMVASGSQAQRLASIDLEQSRRSRTLTCTCNLRALPARVGGSCLVTLARHFDQQPMRIMESTFVVGNDGSLLLKLTMIETDEEIYAWDRTREHQVNIPPAINATGPTVATPAFSPEAGEFVGPGGLPVAVSISTLTSGATIRYSLSALPTTPTEGTAYTTPISIDDGDTLYARAFKTGYAASAPAIGAYIEI